MTDARFSSGELPGSVLHVAYIVNRYPSMSVTFIRREIQALERLGARIERISVRTPWFVGEEDRGEAVLTRHVLERGWIALVVSMLFTAVTRPRRFVRAAFLAARLGRRSGRSNAVHIGYLAESCTAARWIRRSGARHIHAHFGASSTDVAALAAELTGLPFSFTAHGPEEFDRPVAINLSEKVKRAAFVVAVSSFGRSQIFRWIDHEQWTKVHVIRCGIDAAFRDYRATNPPDNHRFVCIGRLSEQKGQELLITAMALLRDRGLDAELVIVGDGELRTPIERLIEELAVGDRITISGWLTSLEVREILVGSRALLLPSFAEGLPVVLMEAMALGRPVLSSNIAGIPELVVDGETGWLFPAGDVEAIVDAVERCLKEPAVRLNEMGVRARARVVARHDIDAEAQELFDLIMRTGS